MSSKWLGRAIVAGGIIVAVLAAMLWPKPPVVIASSNFVSVDFNQGSYGPGDPIDVGPAVIDRGAYGNYGNTMFDVDNPANATGTITSITVWANTNIVGLRVGTFYLSSGTTYICRDSEACGNITAGSAQTVSNLTINVSAGDYIGCYFASGRIEHDTSGYGGTYQVTGEYIDPGDSASYTAYAGDASSLNGTGSEPAGVTVNYTVNQSSYSFGIVNPSATVNTTGNWILFTNSSSVSTNISVKMLAATWTSSGSGWTHNDSAAGVNTATMKAASDNGTTWSSSVFVKYTAPFNEIGSNIAANSNYTSGLSLLAPTSFTDGSSNNNTVRFSFYTSS